MDGVGTTMALPQRRVVDALTRALHALMALSFGLAYLTAEMEGWRLLHVTMGYSLGLLFALRLLWAAFGPMRVGLKALRNRVSAWPQVRAMMARLEAGALLQQVLAGSMLALLACVLPLLVSGYATYFEYGGGWTEDIHESVGNLMLAFAGAHVATVLVLHWRSPNRPRPMWTGLVPGRGPNLVQHNMAAAAWFVVLLVSGFCLWQAHVFITDPQLQHQPQWLHPIGGYSEDSEDSD